MAEAGRDDQPQHQLLAQRLKDYLPRRGQRYEAVHVLTLSWDEDDIGPHLAREVAELQHMFRKDFKYAVSHYMIPSKDPGTSLNSRIAHLIDVCGGDENLIIVYYSGHGGPKVSTKSPCTWAAKNGDGPDLDWSCIQPSLFLASCDCVLLLDCCYAGQAARSPASRSMELLAATDKDNWTPTGVIKQRPSFTSVLIREMKVMLSTEGFVTLPSLQRQMVAHESGLMRQPFFVSMKGDASSGPIRLVKMGEKPNELVAQGSTTSSNLLHLRVTLFDILDSGAAAKILRWLTKDSPNFIADVEFTSQVVADVKGASVLGKSLLSAPEGKSLKPSILSKQAQAEAQKLFDEIQLALHETGDDNRLNGPDIVSKVRNACTNFLTFASDTLATMDRSHLGTLELGDSIELKELEKRIALRLTLIKEDAPLEDDSRPFFENQTLQNQRLRVGKSDGKPVLVEYISYDNSDPEASNRMFSQAKKICALQAETISSAFRCLPSLGVFHETLYGPRYGLVHDLPGSLAGRSYAVLSDLIKQIKNVPLGVRMLLACSLCNAVLHLHSIGWYHKNIKSTHVLIFGSDGATPGEDWDLKNPYLIGFDCSRPAAAETRNSADFSLPDNLFRHPARWGHPVNFAKHHDTYSLGILLMEIGRWRNLLAMDSKKEGFKHVRKPEMFRTLLLTEHMDKLAHAAGTSYMQAVKVCLDRRDWMTYEEWQSQRIIREEVLDPIMKCSKIDHS